jgi:hypothetical protein
MGKGSGRRPEAVKGAFERGWEIAFGCKHDWVETGRLMQTIRFRCSRCKEERVISPVPFDRRTRTDQGRETDARDADAGNLVR